jgi:hypothetical protein
LNRDGGAGPVATGEGDLQRELQVGGGRHGWFDLNGFARRATVWRLAYRLHQLLDAMQGAVGDAELFEVAHGVGEIVAAGAAVTL